MVFSLVFNFVYKKNLEDAYNAWTDFLDSIHKYVAPRAQNNAGKYFLGLSSFANDADGEDDGEI